MRAGPSLAMASSSLRRPDAASDVVLGVDSVADDVTTIRSLDDEQVEALLATLFTIMPAGRRWVRVAPSPSPRPQNHH